VAVWENRRLRERGPQGETPKKKTTKGREEEAKGPNLQHQQDTKKKKKKKEKKKVKGELGKGLVQSREKPARTSARVKRATKQVLSREKNRCRRHRGKETGTKVSIKYPRPKKGEKWDVDRR